MYDDVLRTCLDQLILTQISSDELVLFINYLYRGVRYYLFPPLFTSSSSSLYLSIDGQYYIFKAIAMFGFYIHSSV